MAAKIVYHRRLVADSAAKACWICYKPSSTVLITADSDDWFHICPGHLTDRHFAIAQDAVDEEQVKRQAELEREIEAVKKEYEERLKKKKDKKKGKDDKKEDTSHKDEEKEKEDKLKELEGEKAKSKAHEPRIYELNKSFQQMRLQKKQQAAIAKRNKERLQDKSAFPAVPTGDVSKG